MYQNSSPCSDRHSIVCLFCSSLHLLVDPWVVSTSWLFWNNAAMNIGIQASVWVPAFKSWGHLRRGMKLHHHKVVLYSLSEELPNLPDYTILHHFSDAPGFQFLHIFTNACYFLCLFFYNSHVNGYQAASHCVCLFAFSLREQMNLFYEMQAFLQVTLIAHCLINTYTSLPIGFRLPPAKLLHPVSGFLIFPAPKAPRLVLHFASPKPRRYLVAQAGNCRYSPLSLTPLLIQNTWLYFLFLLMPIHAMKSEIQIRVRKRRFPKDCVARLSPQMRSPFPVSSYLDPFLK